MSKMDLELQNADGNTAFCIAAISGNVHMIEIMLKKNPALITICGSENMMPLYLAAYHGNHDVVTFLYDRSDRMIGNNWTDDNRYGVLLKCIQSNIFDVAVRIIKDNEELPQDKHLWDVLHVLSRKPEAFELVRRETTPAFRAILFDTVTPVWRFMWAKLALVLNGLGELFGLNLSATKLLVENSLFSRREPRLHFKEITAIVLLRLLWKSSSNRTTAIVLLRLLWKRIMKKPKDFVDEILRGPMVLKQISPGHNMGTYPSQVLFIAAKMNNKRFLAELIHGYPDLIWKRNDDGQTIFHIAVAHRHEDIYNLLYEIGSLKDMITPMTDKEGNNILHLAGKKPEKTNFVDRLTSKSEVDRETYWFKKVQRTLPPSCREMKNEEGHTPQELFVETHGEKKSDRTKWIHDTINVSMVVAALVCTISFSVIYSIPGGFNQNNGLPMFLHNKHYITFMIMDVISFIMSSSSIILFLSIVLSRQRVNRISLFQRWLAAQVLLLTSIFFLVVAFCSSFYILYRKTVWTSLLNILAFVITGSCTTLSLYAVMGVPSVTYGPPIQYARL
ncbi:putative ankyrin repeat-containing domain, PGG domain, ankyrin repeat-containing domain superfamily [Helianthus anomalus]